MHYCFGECELSETRYELKRGGSLVHVEPQVLDLLLFLVKERGRLVNRDKILDAVWDGRIVSDSAVSSRIKAARQAIGDDGKRQDFIETVPRRGFRFIAPVEIVQTDPVVPADASSPGRADSMPPSAGPEADSLQTWLQEIGMAGYVDCFVDNRIDRSLLPGLGDRDLKEIGIAPLGDRKIILGAIETLRDAASGQTGKPIQSERRQLSVMSVTLDGASALSQRLDPEDLSDTLSLYQAAITNLVNRYGGHVAHAPGAEMTVYFGWPTAHENQAERAVRVGLEAVQAIAAMREGNAASLRAKVGIATGPVVLNNDAVALGETPNLAIRLQQSALPDQVTISEETFRQVRRHFVTVDLGALSFDDFAGTVPAWRVESDRPLSSRFEASHVSPLTRFVGRRQELDLLSDRWAQCKTGDGQVVLVSGEAGIGKSRLLHMLEQRLGDESYTRLNYQCSPFYVNSALQPVIRALETAAGFAADDDGDARLDKLQTLLHRAGSESAENVLFFGALLSLPVEALDLTPQQVKDRTLQALVGQLRSMAEAEPLLILLEDAHWIDPTTIEFLEQVIPALSGSRVLLVITHRPEWRPPWAEAFGNQQAFSLTRLGRIQVADMVQAVIGDDADSTFIDQIADRTDGIPLYVEEMTLAAMEAGGTGAGDQAFSPPTLQTLFMERLDRLGDARDVAQVGAVIGREFNYRLLAEVCDMEEAAIQKGLDRLIDSGLAYGTGARPDATYIFKHALVRDSAYDNLLISRRKELHGRVASALVDKFPETAEVEPELIAYHYSAAEDPDHACSYWQKAGEMAMARSSYQEATAHLRKALDALSALPNTRERLSRELDIQISLGPVLMATTGYASVEAKRAYLRAHELCRRIDDKNRLKHVLVGLRYVNQIGGNTTAARDFAQQCLDLANATNDSVLHVQANACLGHSACIYGEFEKARDFIHRCNRVHEPAQHDAHLRLSGLDPGVVALNTAGWNEWFLGYPDAALQASEDAYALAEQLDHPHSVEQALNSAAYTHMLRGEVDKVRDCAERAIAISKEHGFRYRIAMAGILHGWALSASGDHDDGIAELQTSLSDCRETGSQTWQVFYLTLISESYHRAMRFDEGREAIREAMTFVELGEEKWWNAEIQRQFGLSCQADDRRDYAAAEAAYMKALEIARGQSAKSWELRAAMSLARLWQSQGKTAEARDLLQPVHDWFTEGFDTMDLKAAKTLLESLT